MDIDGTNIQSSSNRNLGYREGKVDIVFTFLGQFLKITLGGLEHEVIELTPNYFSCVYLLVKSYE